MVKPLWNVIFEFKGALGMVKYDFYVPADNAPDAMLAAIEGVKLRNLGAEAILKVEKTKMEVYFPK